MSSTMTGAPVKVFGLDFSFATAREIASLITQPVSGTTVKLIATANTQHVGRLRHDTDFQAAYRFAALITADGFPVRYYARAKGCLIPERVTGYDILEELMRRTDLTGQRLFFVTDSDVTAGGLRAWAARRAVEPERLMIEIPPMGFEHDADYCRGLADRMRAFGATLIIMGVGAPRSEVFIHRQRDRLPPGWALCVGEAVKVEAGTKPRAPVWARKLNAEWAWRLMLEPRRLMRRYTIEMAGFALAIAEDWRADRANNKDTSR
jgi:N-acetylglucosaminyldiphosphoundecaprenol N-acetyl-beta-D-mannosaminyltransferase